MFGIKQISEFVRETGKTTFTLEELAQRLGVRPRSAKRYALEAQKLGAAKVEDNVVVVDKARLAVLEEAVRGLDSEESLMRLLLALKEKGVVGDVKVKLVSSHDGALEKLQILLEPGSASKALEAAKEAVASKRLSVLVVLAPPYLVPEIFALLRSRYGVPPENVIELSGAQKVIVVEKAAKK